MPDILAPDPGPINAVLGSFMLKLSSSALRLGFTKVEHGYLAFELGFYVNETFILINFFNRIFNRFFSFSYFLFFLLPRPMASHDYGR